MKEAQWRRVYRGCVGLTGQMAHFDSLDKFEALRWLLAAGTRSVRTETPVGFPRRVSALYLFFNWTLLRFFYYLPRYMYRYVCKLCLRLTNSYKSPDSVNLVRSFRKRRSNAHNEYITFFTCFPTSPSGFVSREPLHYPLGAQFKDVPLAFLIVLCKIPFANALLFGTVHGGGMQCAPLCNGHFTKYDDKSQICEHCSSGWCRILQTLTLRKSAYSANMITFIGIANCIQFYVKKKSSVTQVFVFYHVVIRSTDAMHILTAGVV